MAVNLSINDEPRTYLGDPRVSLLEVLRETFRLTGAKDVCGQGFCGACTVHIDGEAVPMVPPSVGFKVLGTQFTLQGRTAVEVKARISAAWAKFHVLWPVLGERDGNLLKRLRLFDSSVSQTLLWCNESWVLTVKEKRLLKSAQNQMLRRIAGPRRQPEEPWVDWIQRSMRAARKVATAAGIRFWLEAHLRSKWDWAGHVLRMSNEMLARRAVQWRDSVWWSQELYLPLRMRTQRPHKTRWFRWEDEVRRYADHCMSTSWQEAAAQKSSWQGHCKGVDFFAQN